MNIHTHEWNLNLIVSNKQLMAQGMKFNVFKKGVYIKYEYDWSKDRSMRWNEQISSNEKTNKFCDFCELY